MNLFRAQLSRLIPHPHRDSWMRNHLDQWLYLLRAGVILLFLAKAWIYHFHGSTLVKDLSNNESLSSLTSHEKFSSYANLTLVVLLCISSLLVCRCGKKKKPKYILPVAICGIILLADYLLEIMDAGEIKTARIIELSAVYSIPFFLLGYRRLQNKVDHWNLYALVACAISLVGFSLSFTALPSSSIQPPFSTLTYLGLTEPAANNVLNITGYVHFAVAFFLFFSITRRIALYGSILFGAFISATFLFAAIIGDCAQCAHFWLPTTVSLIPLWLIPTLILLSLASRRKNQTLRI